MSLRSEIAQKVNIAHKKSLLKDNCYWAIVKPGNVTQPDYIRPSVFVCFHPFSSELFTGDTSKQQPFTIYSKWKKTCGEHY